MKRRYLLMLAAVAPVALVARRYLTGGALKMCEPGDFRAQAERLNALGANIRTLADARSLVDFVADVFYEQTHDGWAGAALRGRIAQAEYFAATDARGLISEERLVQAWNGFVRTIGGQDDYKVTQAELHNLRDALLTMSLRGWERGERNPWAAPALYATGPDGWLAGGGRAVESLRVLWDMANLPGNLMAARERARKGVLASDLFRRAAAQGSADVTGSVRIEVRDFDPLERAQMRYIEVKGMRAYRRAALAMLDETFG